MIKNQATAPEATAQILQEPVVCDRQLVTEETLASITRGPEDGSRELANTGEDSVPVAPQEMIHSLARPNDGDGGPMLTRRELLTQYEHIVEESLAREDRRGEALLAIHEQKLYTLTHTSFRDYLKQRWRLSRSRVYQLLHLARLKRHGQLNGQPAPANERQARQFAAEGTRLPKGRDETSYARHLRRVTHYLQANVAKSPPGERRRFLIDVRNALDRLEQDLDTQPPTPGPDPTLLPNEPKLCASSTVASPGTPSEVSRPLSAPPRHPRGAGATTEANSRREVPSTPTSVASQEQGLPPHPQPGSGSAQEPHGNVGSVLGLTMDQARRFGYCRR